SRSTDRVILSRLDGAPLSANFTRTYSFFFQAGEGIRDGHVTGVQTCALPISALADFFGPAEGDQACGEIGEGRMLEPVDLAEREIGRASCRERGEVAGGVGPLKKKAGTGGLVRR